MQDGRGLVVDHGAKDAAVAADVAEPVAEVDRALIGLLHPPAPELAEHARERVVAAPPLRVQRREVLREPLAQPLLVIVAPADRLAPPLVRDLVGDEELGKVLERRRIVAPHVGRGRQRLVQRGEVSRTVAAGQIALDERRA